MRGGKRTEARYQPLEHWLGRVDPGALRANRADVALESEAKFLELINSGLGHFLDVATQCGQYIADGPPESFAPPAHPKRYRARSDLHFRLGRQTRILRFRQSGTGKRNIRPSATTTKPPLGPLIPRVRPWSATCYSQSASVEISQ